MDQACWASAQDEKAISFDGSWKRKQTPVQAKPTTSGSRGTSIFFSFADHVSTEDMRTACQLCLAVILDSVQTAERFGACHKPKTEASNDRIQRMRRTPHSCFLLPSSSGEESVHSRHHNLTLLYHSFGSFPWQGSQLRSKTTLLRDTQKAGVYMCRPCNWFVQE